MHSFARSCPRKGIGEEVMKIKFAAALAGAASMLPALAMAEEST